MACFCHLYSRTHVPRVCTTTVWTRVFVLFVFDTFEMPNNLKCQNITFTSFLQRVREKNNLMLYSIFSWPYCTSSKSSKAHWLKLFTIVWFFQQKSVYFSIHTRWKNDDMILGLNDQLDMYHNVGKIDALNKVHSFFKQYFAQTLLGTIWE